MGEMIRIENATASFPDVFTPTTGKKYPKAPPRYGCTFLVSPSDPVLQQIQGAIARCSQDNNCNVLPEIKTDEKDSLGRTAIRSYSSSKKPPPAVVDINNNIIDPIVGAREIYPGIRVHGMIDIYYTPDNNRVCIGLLGIQKITDGERLDNTPDVNNLFQPIPVAGGFDPLA